MPAEIRRWNWGAFLMTWLWGIAHNVWLSLLIFIPVVNIFVWIYLGMKGSELAWMHRRFDNLQQFKDVQKAWTTWGIVILAIALAPIFYLIWIILALMSAY